MLAKNRLSLNFFPKRLLPKQFLQIALLTSIFLANYRVLPTVMRVLRLIHTLRKNLWPQVN